MHYILVMSLSGSVMFFMYQLVSRLSGEKIRLESRYVMLKISVLYFICPLPFLKVLYKHFIDVITEIFSDAGIVSELYVYHNKSLVLYDGEHYYINLTLRLRVILACIWLSFALVIMTVIMAKHVKESRRILRIEAGKQKTMKDGFDAIKNDLGIKRNIRFVNYQSDQSDRVNFTMGVFRPIIVYTKSEDVDLIMRHEMQHIKNLDTLWRILSLAACIVHWFNPFSWWLWKEIEYISERICDVSVTKNMDRADKERYVKLLVQSSLKDRTGIITAMNSEGGKKLMMRIENIINADRTVWKRSVGVCFTIAMAFLSSLSVYAYEDVQYIQQESDMSISEIDEMINDSDIILEIGSDNDYLWLAEEYEIVYDLQFIDEEGNIYYINEEHFQTEAVCNHTYVDGTVVQHTKNSTGGCTVTVYSAQICSNCMAYIIIEKISTTIYTTCPH